MHVLLRKRRNDIEKILSQEFYYVNLSIFDLQISTKIPIKSSRYKTFFRSKTSLEDLF